MTACRGDGGIRSLLRLPPALGASNEGLTPAEESLALRLYIIPVPILDLRPALKVSIVAVTAGGEVNAEFVYDVLRSLLPEVPVTPGTLLGDLPIDGCCDGGEG